MAPEKKRWWILAFGLLANMCQGPAYTVSVFGGAMRERLNGFAPPDAIPLTAQDGRWAFAVSMSVALLPLGMLLAGRLADRGRGPWAVGLGALLFGGGLFGSAFVTTIEGLWITYGAMTSLGSGMAYGTIVGASVRWFPDRRGLASGLSVAALGAGGVVIAPLARALIPWCGVDGMFWWFGVGAFVMIALSAWFVRNPPEGWTPAGWTPPASRPAPGGAKTSAPAPASDMTWWDMVRSGRFYALWLLYFSGTFACWLVFPRCFDLIRNPGYAVAAAVGAVQALTFANSGGRLLWAAVSDRIGRWPAMAGMLSLTAVSIGVLGHLATRSEGALPVTTTATPPEQPLPTEGMPTTEETPTAAPRDTTEKPDASVTDRPTDGRWFGLMAAVVVAGLCFGGVLGTFPALCAESFGTRNATMNYGVLFTAFSASALAAPQAAAAWGFGVSAYGAAGLALVGLVLTWGLSRPRRGTTK